MQRRIENSFELKAAAEIPQNFEEHIAPHLEGMRQEIRRRLVEKDPDYPEEVYDEETEAYLQRELEFCRQVVAAYERWSQEDNLLVLWDIDDTMLKHGYTGERFRVSLFPLMGYLSDNFPDVANGLLTTRSRLEEQLADARYLKMISGFIDPRHLHSSQGVEISMRVRADMDKRATSPDKEGMQKLTVVRSLEEQGFDVGVIDDNNYVKILGDKGLCVFKLAPRV